MSDMVERLARAIFDAAWHPGAYDSDAASPVEREEAIVQARAAIEAMRDCDAVSARMLLAGKKALFSCTDDPEFDDARGCYQAMIDAALREDK